MLHRLSPPVAPDGFEYGLVRNEKGSCAASDKDQSLTQIVSQRLRDRLQHVNELTSDCSHFLRSLSERRSDASPISL
ncbi:hypothetical protein JOH48_002793 [Bradyrhizobium elkanii]|nr:hypothetical protein [Bradyrhizobium elkanii]